MRVAPRLPGKTFIRTGLLPPLASLCLGGTSPTSPSWSCPSAGRRCSRIGASRRRSGWRSSSPASPSMEKEMKAMKAMKAMNGSSTRRR
eukprot:14608042-Heterocapsa_arctica.AAC.1